MLKRILIFTCGCMLVAATAFAAVTDEVRKTVDNVIQIVSDKNLRKPAYEQQRRTAIKKAISVIFDHREMAKRSLATHWEQRSKAEQNQFAALFANLLENSYASKIESYNNEKIVYTKEIVDGNYAEVKSKVVTARKDEFTLDYKMLKKQDGTWVVYDIMIEGVSLVSNYRTQFNKIIRNSGYQALVQKMQTKSDELKIQ